MEWVKRGKIFERSKEISFSNTHTALPTPFLVDKDTIRIYYATRDSEQKSRITYIDVEAKNPSIINYIHDQSIFELGELGTFDDRGATPSGLFIVNNKKYFYYNGYNIGSTARYRIAIGIAEMDLECKNAIKFSSGPIQDRNIFDPCGVATPFIVYDNLINKYIIYYTSFTHWKIINGEKEPFYRICRAESNDGINWENKSICIDFERESEGGIVRPTVMILNGKYHMWYSIRLNTNYREDLKSSYRIKHAVSHDGKIWEKDNTLSIEPSDDINEWDGLMTAYPYIVKTPYGIYMFYNGNGFGQSGFGYAVLEE